MASSDGGVTKYYQAYGRAVAMREAPPAGGAGTLSYLLADHLGGTVEVLDAAGATVAETKYWPYGATRTGGIAQTDKLYTGQQQEPGDAALGLYHYKARFYSTTVGRFVAADRSRDGFMAADDHRPRQASMAPRLWYDARTMRHSPTPEVRTTRRPSRRGTIGRASRSR